MKNLKRVFALIIVILWVALIIATLICSFIPSLHGLFVGLMYTDIGLPVVAYAIILVARILKKNEDA